MKDIEFYISDLRNLINNDSPDKNVAQTTQSVIQICDSLNAALQLYIISCVLEVYYSGNTNNQFIENMKTDVAQYIEKCHSRILSDVSVLKGKLESMKVKRNFDKKPCLDSLSAITDSIGQGKTRELQGIVDTALDRVNRQLRFVVTSKDELYCEVS